MSGIYIRNIIFGVADSLVSTVGLLSGVNISGTPRATIILTGVVYAFVEAFSMAVGSFLSEQSIEEYEAKKETPNKKPFLGGTVMFFSFVTASFIPITPYFILNPSTALWLSIVLSIGALFFVGIIIAKISHTHPFQHGLKMTLLGGAAILIGVLVGKVLRIG